MISDDRLKFASHYLLDPKCLSEVSSNNSLPNVFNEFPFVEHKNNQASCTKVETLLRNIASACEKTLTMQGEPVLLLSSGKDSMALALGFAELGISVQCVSLVTDEEEREYIEAILQKIGHVPHFITLSQIKSNSGKFVDLSLCNSRYVCLDQAIFPMYVALQDFFSGQKLNIIDGMGNDVYFGHLPSKYQIQSYRYGSLRHILPNELRYYFRNFTSAMGLRTALSFISPEKNISNIKDKFLRDFINFKPDSNEDVDIVNARAFIRGEYIDNFVYAEKTRIIAENLNCNVSFPWMDRTLAYYCFNLPKELKYNFEKLENKILLRKLLREKFNYNRPKKGIDLLFQLSEREIIKILQGNQVPGDRIGSILKSRMSGASIRKRALFELLLIQKHKVG